MRVPPFIKPGHHPRPKAEDGEDQQAVSAWIEATQQPVTDWDWDGETLTLNLDDGSTETYTRQQLDDIGVFGQMSFAESFEEDEDPEEEEDVVDDSPDEDEDGENEEDDSSEEAEDESDTVTCDFGSECAPGDPDSVIKGLLGTGKEIAEPEPVEQLTMAVDNLVQAIIGVAATGTATGPDHDANGEMVMASPDERPDTNYCPEQLEKGINDEMEHTSDQEEAKKIAKDHLDKDTEYYAKE